MGNVWARCFGRQFRILSLMKLGLLESQLKPRKFCMGTIEDLLENRDRINKITCQNLCQDIWVGFYFKASECNWFDNSREAGSYLSL